VHKDGKTMKRTIGVLAASGVLAAGVGLGVAAQQKPAAPSASGTPAKVTVYKSPT
jgi:hypothetical protein